TPTNDSDSVLIDKTTLWDNLSVPIRNVNEIDLNVKDDTKDECLAPLSDKQWQSVCAIKDMIDIKYSAQTTAIVGIGNVGRTIESESDYVPWTNSDLQQLDEWLNKWSLIEPNDTTTEVHDTFQHLCSWEDQCKTLYNDVHEAVQYLDTLHDTYAKVSYKTNSLYKA
ncbi:unnamed protein product, partial [Didymodactylos carnosus]